MRELPADSTLVSDLRKHRKGRGLTQGQLAAAADVAERTVRPLEQGQGNLDSWRGVLEPLGVELVGRNLPAGPSLRQRLAKLRSHRGLGQRELAAMVGVTQPTIVALERRDKGRLSTLERVHAALGAGAYLAAIGQAKAFYSHAGNSSNNQAWETPVALLETLHGVFGRFDLNPCAPRRSRARVRARVHLTEGDDGTRPQAMGTLDEGCKSVYAHISIRRLRTPIPREKLGSAVRRLVEQHHVWDVCLQPLSPLLRLRP